MQASPHQRRCARLEVVLHAKKTKKATGKRPRCIDLSNSLKVAEDSLIGIAFTDDAQTRSIAMAYGEPVSWRRFGDHRFLAERRPMMNPREVGCFRRWRAKGIQAFTRGNVSTSEWGMK